MPRAWPVAASLLVAAITTTAGAPDPPPMDIGDFGEISEHLLGTYPRVETSWADITVDQGNQHWVFDLEVDERGIVRSAKLTSGSRDYRDEAQRAVEELRFKPFIRDGRAVSVRLEWSVWSRPADYAGPADRTFPVKPDLSETVIALSRTGCLGACPSYRVELHGNGDVYYLGDSDVLVKGRHRWRVDPAKVATLLELFRRANYFALDGYYEYPVTDLPTYITRLSIGDRNKFVLNYGGSGFGGAAASTRLPGDVPDMPPVVSEIEQAIDEISGADAYVSGDESTIQRLRDEGWNFRSRNAGHAVRMALAQCKTALARELIRAGAPVNVAGEGYFGESAIVHAAFCADVDIARLMIARGALQRKSDAKSFLWAGVSSGNPDMVALAMTRYRRVNGTDEDGASLLAHAASSYANEDTPNATRFDSAKVVEMLVDAGANPNARDADGRTPLFEANDRAVAAALIRKGADPNARDNEGRTALFDHYFAEVKAVLVAAGADVNARDDAGRTALFWQMYPDTVKALITAGADIEAVDSKGRTAIEAMNTESFVAALLEAGAKLPKDPVRLDAMIAKATEKEWTEVLPLLRAGAGMK